MKTQKTVPTLFDVASRAGVSTATVSRCLNFPGQVKAPTRDKVMTAVRDLGYSPNFAARAMAARRTMTIGAIIPTMENAIFARGLQAFQEELRVHGYTLLVASSSYRPDVEEEQIRSLVARGADALLLIGHERDRRVYEFLDAQGVPSLVTWAFDRSVERPSVGFDNRAAMRKMADEVLRLGHRDLALISAEISTNDRAAARRDGIRDAMEAAGLNSSDLRVIETHYSVDHGASAFRELLAAAPFPTAVFCGNDVLAVGAIRMAREMNIAVPDRVSIVGFDDIELAEIAVPPLSTVHVPHREMGRRAAQALVGLLEEGRQIVPTELSATLVLRNTLAKAPEQGH